MAAALAALALQVNAAPAGGDTPGASEAAAALRFAQAQAAQAASDIVVLDATINGESGGPALVHVLGSDIAIEEAALARWRVIFPATAAAEFDGVRFVPMSALSGMSASIEQRTQRLVLTVPAQLFHPSSVFLKTVVNLPPTPPPWSAFANYDLFGYTSNASSYGSALWEIGTAGPYGSGIASAVSNSSQASGGNSGRTALLEATWRYDAPSGPRTLLAGTGISRSGAWGRSLRFGGVQYGSNFSLQPNLITYPVQAFAGTAVVPSTVDVLVNGSRVASQQVSPGPFNIENVPVVTGSGNVQLVIRDAFGQQQVISQPFYASRQLLAPGLDDFTLSAGAERQNYGSESFDYGSGFASAYWRRGLTDSLTVEALAMGDNQARAAGVTVDFIPPVNGVVTLGAAGSSGQAGGGVLGIAGYQYQGAKLNFAVRSTWASPNFRSPGDDPVNPLQRLSVANVGYNFGAEGSIGVAWASQQNRGLPASSTGVVSYSLTLSPKLYMNFSLSRSNGSSTSTGGFLSFVYALTQDTFASADVSSTRTDDGTHTIGGVTVQRSLPVGEGWGYRVRAQTDDQFQAGVIYAGPYGRYALEAASQDGVAAARGTIAGGIGVVGGVAFASRPVIDSFALVRVAGVPDVSVYQGGNFAGRTDAAGNVILTQLSPYIANRIVINDREVPIDITLDSREKLVAPYYRSGAIVDFGARRMINALVDVRLADGSPLPSGAEVRRVAGGPAYPPGLDGEVFIPDLEYDAPYVARWATGACRFVVPATAATAEIMPRFAAVPCVAARE